MENIYYTVVADDADKLAGLEFREVFNTLQEAVDYAWEFINYKTRVYKEFVEIDDFTNIPEVVDSYCVWNYMDFPVSEEKLGVRHDSSIMPVDRDNSDLLDLDRTRAALDNRELDLEIEDTFKPKK